MNEPDDTQEPGAERNAHTAGSGTSPVNGFSFSRVSVFGLQRKCACGGVAGPSGECTECRRKRALGLQPKLTVNQPGDAYELEADRVAQAMMGSFSHLVQPRSEQETDLDHPAESELTKGGERLSPDVTDFYETRFGHDFSAVRVHTGETAMRYNEAVNAYAFTYGTHIWLGPGLQPRPSHILAHELAHVVQQTQPPPLEAEPNQPASSPSRQSVQRYQPYWIPAEFIAKSKTARPRVGTPTHKLVLPRIGEVNGIFTEAPVPNADSEGHVGLNFRGIADLYQASTTVGVYFDGAKLPRELPSAPELKFRGKPLEKFGHINNSAPRADEYRQSVIRAGRAPREILIGDLKPSHGTQEAEKGPQQVKDYQDGFKFARSLVNAMSIGEGGLGQTDAHWPELNTGIIDIEIPDEFKVETRGSGQKSRALVQVHNGRVINPPRAVAGRGREFVMGKVYVTESPEKGGGIWNYVWEPDTELETADLPKKVTDFDAEVKSTLIEPVLESPIKGARKPKPTPRPSSLTPSPRRILRQARGGSKAAADVKDPFDFDRWKRWEADHARLTREETLLEKTPEFEEAEFRSLAIQDRQAAIRSGFDLPAVTPREEKAARIVDRVRFWTGKSSAVLGKLRYHFGGVFVKVVNAYHSIRARFQKLLEDKKFAARSGGLPGTIIRIAFGVLKTAGRVIVGRTAQYLVDSLRTGVERKLKALIPQDKLEEFEAKVQEIEALADDLERRAVETVDDLVKKVIGPYETHIEIITKVADELSKVSDVVSKVRWGARVIACLSPPGWGCLWILAESVIEKFASWLIDKCWFKKEIAPLVTSVGFIATLPAELAKIIIDVIRGVLPAQLHDVFADIKPDQISTNIPSHEICDESDYPTARDRDLVERLALAELRKEIGEEKWQAWIKLAELYGVNRGQPLSLERISQLKKELKKANLAALKEAADMHTAMPPGRDVVNLTTFLEEVERVKQEMYGVGPGGQGGEAGIQIPAAEKELPGAYNLKFKFQVVGGVKAGDYHGAVINVDFADMIKGTLVTLDDVEVVVRKRVFIPNERNPEKIEVGLEVTKDQYFDVEKKYGTAFVDKIGVKRFKVSKGNKKRYTLQLRTGTPGQ